LIKAGLHVVIGVNHEIAANLELLPPGVFLVKGLNRVQCNVIQEVNRLGHLSIAIDEECLGIADPAYMMRDVADDIAQHIHTIYCQGGVQRDSLPRYRGVPAEKLKLTGNPRVDLMREPFHSLYAGETEEIRKRFGRFILINTNSGCVNNLWADMEIYRQILTQIGWADPLNREDQFLVEDHIEHDQNNILAIKDFVRNFASLAPNIPIVLRPHPSERPDSWVEFAKDFESLTVISDSGPAPWLLAADLIVSTGCTTGTEAVVMGKDAISLVAQPNHVRHPAFFLVNQVAHQETNARRASETAIAAMQGYRRSITINESGRATTLAEHIDDGQDAPAFEKIGKHIASLIGSQPNAAEASLPFNKIAFPDNLEVKKVAWEKAYCSPQEIGSRLS
jgi:surface carbohydrate biosynthesis protein